MKNVNPSEVEDVYTYLRVHFTNDYFVTIQIWWKFHFAPLQIPMNWSWPFLCMTFKHSDIYKNVLQYDYGELNYGESNRISIEKMFVNLFGDQMILCSVAMRI